MHPLVKLRKLFKEPSTNQGKIVQISDSTLLIATSKGALSIQRNTTDATRYQLGDSVILANGSIVGKRSKNPTVYVI